MTSCKKEDEIVGNPEMVVYNGDWLSVRLNSGIPQVDPSPSYEATVPVDIEPGDVLVVSAKRIGGAGPLPSAEFRDFDGLGHAQSTTYEYGPVPCCSGGPAPITATIITWRVTRD